MKGLQTHSPNVSAIPWEKLLKLKITAFNVKTLCVSAYQLAVYCVVWHSMTLAEIWTMLSDKVF